MRRKPTNNIVIITGIIVLTLLTIGCQKSEKHVSTGKVVLVLVDFSGSAKQSRKAYFDSFKKITEIKDDRRKIEVGDRMVVWKISGKSIMEDQPLIDENFQIPRDVKSDFWRQQEVKKIEKKMAETIPLIEKTMEDQLLLNPDKNRIYRTDILGSLHVAEKIFKSSKQGKSVLVIMSDMNEDSVEYNFSKTDLTSKKIDEIIAREKKKGRVPDLKGVKVYVAGARASSRDRFFKIQSFWLKYFKECGADLSKENYASTLISFEE